MGRADFNSDHFRAEVGCFTLAFLGVIAHFAQPTVQGQCVETVSRRLLASRFQLALTIKRCGGPSTSMPLSERQNSMS